MTGRAPTIRPRSIRPTRSLLLAVVLIVGCTADDDPTGDAGTTDPIGACESTAAGPAIEYRSTSDLTDRERQVIELFRHRSASILVEQNPVTCRGLIEVAAPVEADEFGAFEIKSFAHTGPAVRYDLFWFTERQPIDASTGDAITARLSSLGQPQTSLRVWTVAATLFLAVTTPTGDDEATAIADHYNQLIAGEE